METTQPKTAANIDRFSGFADCYDAYRPQPPAVLTEVLSQLAGVSIPRLVVDIGCGTGLSTRIWKGRANEVVGVEPNDDMRAKAESLSQSDPEFRFIAASSHDTGLPDGCADIVTCSQSLHWMEPVSTFAEIARILRPRGVFAAVDCDWPPAMNPAAEQAHAEFGRRTHRLEEEHGVNEAVARWPKHQHLERIRESGHFHFTKEILLHNVEKGSAERLVGLALSMGGIETLLKLGLTEEQIGITDLRAAAQKALGDGASKWFFSYRVRVGVK